MEESSRCLFKRIKDRNLKDNQAEGTLLLTSTNTSMVSRTNEQLQLHKEVIHRVTKVLSTPSERFIGKDMELEEHSDGDCPTSDTSEMDNMMLVDNPQLESYKELLASKNTSISLSTTKKDRVGKDSDVLKENPSCSIQNH